MAITAANLLQPRAKAVTFYTSSALLSDVPGLAPNTATNLAGAWGMARSPASPWWLNSTLGGKSLQVDGNGVPYPTNSALAVAIPPVPSRATGIVFNGDTGTNGGFYVESNLPAEFIFVTLDGSIAGWNPYQSNRDEAVLMVSNGPPASYTGVTVASLNGTNALYVANFAENRVEVYNQSFSNVDLGLGAFTDADVPPGLAVFNVREMSSNLLFVTYVPTNIFSPSGTNDVAPGDGTGNGFVSVYGSQGTLVGELEHGPWMNAPWAVIPGPNVLRFNGSSVNTALVGMFGSGEIAAFDADRGTFRGVLESTNGQPVAFGKGLWGLGYGNGGAAGPTNVLYYSQDLVSTNGFHGIFGALIPIHQGSNTDDQVDDYDMDDNPD